MKIVFYSNQLSERGTETALIDYAAANKKILGNESILAFPKNKIYSSERYNQLTTKYEIYLIDSIIDFKNYLSKNSIDLLYVISDGISRDIADEIQEVKTFVHAVFSTRRKHGTFYCPIHEYLNKYYWTSYPVLPHIVKQLPKIPNNLRQELKIPETSKVFGCYAGKEKFDINFVKKTIYKIAKKNDKIFFIFMNIENFIKKDFDVLQENIIFIPGTTDEIFKSKFINTCDAMIHARSDGETFGLSVAEFSSLNKPIITYKPDLIKTICNFIKSFCHRRLTYSQAHIMNLGDTGIYYKNSRQLNKIIINFKTVDKNYDCYTSFFSEENVIKQFQNILQA